MTAFFLLVRLMTKEQCFKCEFLKFDIIIDSYIGCLEAYCANKAIKGDRRCVALIDSISANRHCPHGPKWPTFELVFFLWWNRVEVKLTKSQQLILSVLRKKGKKGITPKQLLDSVPFAPRTVRYALRKLLMMKLVKRIPHLGDMRQYIYTPA